LKKIIIYIEAMGEWHHRMVSVTKFRTQRWHDYSRREKVIES
jgi:hypothetical protein